MAPRCPPPTPGPSPRGAPGSGLGQPCPQLWDRGLRGHYGQGPAGGYRAGGGSPGQAGAGPARLGPAPGQAWTGTAVAMGTSCALPGGVWAERRHGNSPFAPPRLTNSPAPRRRAKRRRANPPLRSRRRGGASPW